MRWLISHHSVLLRFHAGEFRDEQDQICWASIGLKFGFKDLCHFSYFQGLANISPKSLGSLKS